MDVEKFLDTPFKPFPDGALEPEEMLNGFNMTGSMPYIEEAVDVYVRTMCAILMRQDRQLTLEDLLKYTGLNKHFFYWFLRRNPEFHLWFLMSKRGASEPAWYSHMPPYITRMDIDELLRTKVPRNEEKFLKAIELYNSGWRDAAQIGRELGLTEDSTRDLFGKIFQKPPVKGKSRNRVEYFKSVAKGWNKWLTIDDEPLFIGVF